MWGKKHHGYLLRLDSTEIDYLMHRRDDRPHTFVYMDPPYWQTEGHGVGFGIEQYEEMAEILSKLKGKTIISLKDHPDIRRIFASYHIETTDIRYTADSGKGQEAREVLVFSWDMATEPAGLF